MEIKLEEYNYYIKPGYTDMRKQGETLALLVQNEMNLSPFEKSIFLFCGHNRKSLKALAWDGTGWLLMTKKIMVEGCFKWPKSEEEAMRVTLDQVLGTLKGYDMWTSFKAESPEYV